MKIIVAGGSGFVGKALVRRLLAEGHSVTVLTRDPSRALRDVPGSGAEAWDAKSVGPWGKTLDGADAVINLTGENLDRKRWTEQQKQVILGSRVESTRAVVQAIARASRKPAVLINASGVGYYGNVPSGDVPESHPKGTGFLSDVCAASEAEAFAAVPLGLRTLTLRSGVVLAGDGGALKRMMLPFRLFAGGPIGSGKQWFPWIHRDDVIGGIIFLLGTPGISGPVNFVAPGAVTMGEFSKALGGAMGRPAWAPVPSPVLRIILGEMAEMILTGQRAIPKALTDAGYPFRFPALPGALGDIIRRSNTKGDEHS